MKTLKKNPKKIIPSETFPTDTSYSEESPYVAIDNEVLLQAATEDLKKRGIPGRAKGIYWNVEIEKWVVAR